MGCISSTQQELVRNDNNIDPSPLTENNISQTHPSNLHPSLNNDNPLLIHTSTAVHDWNTADLISYICSLENGKFCDSEYDIFKTGLQSLGINGKTINALCYDPMILKDLGLKDDNDIILIQTKCVELYANNEYFTYNTDSKQETNPQSTAVETEDYEYFPIEWSFPMDDGEKIKNSNYVGQKLLIRAPNLQQIPALCVYVENNWIVAKYSTVNKAKSDEPSVSMSDTNTSHSILPSPTNQNNIHKNYERLHVLRDLPRITKYKSGDKNENISQEQIGQFQVFANEEDLFDMKQKEYGMSFHSTSTSIVGVAVPHCYIDPITYEIMTEPMTSRISGRTYDKQMIFEHIQNYGTDPFNQQSLKRSDLCLNKHLKRAIERWLVNNPNMSL